MLVTDNKVTECLVTSDRQPRPVPSRGRHDLVSCDERHRRRRRQRRLRRRRMGVASESQASRSR